MNQVAIWPLQTQLHSSLTRHYRTTIFFSIELSKTSIIIPSRCLRAPYHAVRLGLQWYLAARYLIMRQLLILLRYRRHTGCPRSEPHMSRQHAPARYDRTSQPSVGLWKSVEIQNFLHTLIHLCLDTRLVGAQLKSISLFILFPKIPYCQGSKITYLGYSLICAPIYSDLDRLLLNIRVLISYNLRTAFTSSVNGILLFRVSLYASRSPGNSFTS